MRRANADPLGIGVEFNVDGLKEYTVQQTVWV